MQAKFERYCLKLWSGLLVHVAHPYSRRQKVTNSAHTCDSTVCLGFFGFVSSSRGQTTVACLDSGRQV